MTNWKLALITVIAVITVAAFIGQAQAYTINDNYIGANPTGNYPQWETADVIGEANIFQISGMNVGFQGTKLSTVQIYTNYVKPISNIGAFGTQLGDLFISTNGYTSGDSKTDTWNTGEKWEYALVFDNHDPNSYNGNLALYKVNYGVNGNIRLTNEFKQSNWAVFREQQETRINTNFSSAFLGQIGSWDIDSVNGIITFNINDNDYLTGTDFGFHWNMTCGNDTIEGGVSAPPVPEPSTFVLLGAGLLGAGLIRRKMRK
jgi:hypothetical protein